MDTILSEQARKQVEEALRVCADLLELMHPDAAHGPSVKASREALAILASLSAAAVQPVATVDHDCMNAIRWHGEILQCIRQKLRRAA